MRTVEFEEQVVVLLKPPSMIDEQCGSLPIWTDGSECISKWKMSFREKMHCLFCGFVWVRIISGNTQPPILIEAHNEMFKEEVKDDLND
jgi:hypothetical protein